MRTPATTPRRNGLALYLLVANLWTWAIWIPTLLIAEREGLILPSPDRYAELIRNGFDGPRHVALALLFSLAVYGPLLGALLASAWEGGARSVRALFAAIGRVRIAPRWYAIAAAIALAMAGVPALLGLALGGLGEHTFGAGAALAWFVPILLLQLLTSGLGEEPGWRGYLWPRLRERIAGDNAIWILGLVWAAWHIPFTATTLARNLPPESGVAALLVTIVTGIAGQTMGLIGLSYLYVWLYQRTESVALMILLHALTNSIPFLFAPLANPALMLLVGFFPWILVILLQWRLGRRRFPGIGDKGEGRV